MPLPSFVDDLGHGIYCIDTGFVRPRYDAAYLVVSDEGRAAFIDTGANDALPRHLAALDALGLARESVDFVIPTHVHLDHAGGAGALMAALPAATMLVHPRGARHMIDPSALFDAACAVYGRDEVLRTYGELVAVPQQRVRTTHDGQRVRLGSRELLLADTPGHALHHHCLWDERSRGWFTGDTFGVSYREFDAPGRAPWILPTAAPSQFEPVSLKASVRRLLASRPECVYVTHFGRVADVQGAAGDGLLAMIDEMAGLGREAADVPDRRERHERLKQGLAQQYEEHLRARGLPATPHALEQLAMDIELNAQGVGLWLDRAPSRAA